MIITNPPVALSDELWMLGSSAYPLYLVQSQQQAALFEGGTSAMAPLLQQQMRELGLDPQAVQMLVITHAHPDHVMAVPLLRCFLPRAAVAASTAAVRTLSAEKALALFAQIDQALTGALLSAGAIAPQHRCDTPREHQIPVDRLLQEGDVVTVGDLGFQVLATTGHSDCSLSFYEPERKILLVSDATGYYLPQYDYWWPNYFADYGQYLQSMRRLAQLESELLCLGHNAVLIGCQTIAEYFDKAIQATERYHQRILELAASGQQVRPIAEELGAEVYQKTQLFPLEFFQKNCNVLVKNSLRYAQSAGQTL